MESFLKCPECGGNKFVEGENWKIKKCAYCGSVVQATVVKKERVIEEEVEREHVVQANIQQSTSSQSAVSAKSKTTAGILAICLGGLGIHKFYLDKNGQGILLLLLSIFFCWTIFVPLLIGLFTLIEGIGLLCMSDSDFETKYG